ncbi:MAG TPA: exo-alpha-sialidase [Bacteroidales bacterium]|nr:exo-alpha-sialidase [Bacteroidales bacterium]
MKYITFLFCFIISFSIKGQNTNDWRYIKNATGHIPDEKYCDQPYVVIADNNTWVCVLTTGPGSESQKGQHIVSSISSDKGVTWSPLTDIEPSDAPPSSWAIPYVTYYGRIYVFYTYNGDNINMLNSEPLRHNTELGWYCFKYSDDNGVSWSDRYRLPMKKIPLDYINPWNGEVQLFWGVSKPITVENSMYFGFTRLAIHPQDMGQGWFYKSDNINYERDPDKLHWEQLPDGEDGLFDTSFGITQEEHNIVSLSNNDLYCIFRTNEGYPGESYSNDGGHAWSLPVYARDKDARVIKTPRACPRLFKCKNGNYLLWYHNNNMKGYDGFRNPAWVLGGVEKNGKIEWSQPEVLLYGDEGKDRISYPDLIEEDGHFWVTETQKEIASVHKIDPALINGLWQQDKNKTLAKEGLIFEKKSINREQSFILPSLPGLSDGSITVELMLNVKELIPGQLILDNTDPAGEGFKIFVTPKRTISISLNDNGIESTWDTDPGVVSSGRQHIVFVVDGQANLITTIVNGKLCDGGRYRFTGWSWFDSRINNINGTGKLNALTDFNGNIEELRIYNRYLTTSEAIGNYNNLTK